MDSIREAKPGTIVWRWWYDGIGATPNSLRLLKVNRVTATVTNGYNEDIRIPLTEFEGWVETTDTDMVYHTWGH